MPNIRDITGMCKAGQVQEAYRLAKEGYASDASSPWAQRALGWALYYTIKNDAEHNDYAKMIEHLDELKSLDQLTSTNDSLIFDNVQFQVAMFVKEHIPAAAADASSKLSALFHRLNDYQLNASRGHSFLLQSFIKFEGWEEMADFIDWWDLNKLLPDDYKPFEVQSGQKLMTLAERAFIAYSKALIKQTDTERVKEFLPKLNDLMTGYPQMLYPGYFYGKLLLKLGSDEDEALKVIIPFARKKAADFGMSEGYKDEFDTVNALQVLSEIRELPARQKAGIASLMGKMITVDGDINYNEVRIYNEVCKACDIDKDFHLEDYPNYTLSGPFVNPEDL